MLRLLQGDVGSGKTVVALLAAAAAVEVRPAGRPDGADRIAGAPASQHHGAARGRKPASMSPFSPAASAGPSAPPSSIGSPSATSIVLIGTHAVFQDDVAFRDLALAIVDEQHRFGVHQRLALARKGEAVDVLVMTATPIPRTLGADLFRRHGYFRAAREAGRAQADRYPHGAERAPRRGGRGGRPRARRGPPGLLGLPAGRGIRERRPRRRAGPLRRAARALRRAGRPGAWPP